jgi:glycosyltransferase involved in cell wall biosynthesis
MKHLIFTSPKQKAFEQTEREWARKELDGVLFISEFSEDDLQANTDFFALKSSFTMSFRMKHLLRFGLELSTILIKDLSSEYSSIHYVKRWRQVFSLLLKVSMQAEILKPLLIENQAKTPYSMWANEHALLLSIAKKRGYIKNCYSRAHGRDVIEHREPITGKLPFQGFKYKYLDGVFCVSRFTQRYIQDRYLEYADKMHVAYLGTEDRGEGPLISESAEFVVASIGRVRNVKRFYLIAEMLLYASKPIRWVHFGDVSENDPTNARYHAALLALLANKNVSLNHLGYTPNNEILDYFSDHYIDCLINTSENEGLPVSIQEAISFGIACMATDVGGTSDIVKETTGLLLKPDFDPESTMKLLEEFIESKCRNQPFRLGIRGFWQANFNAAKNYPLFFHDLRMYR